MDKRQLASYAYHNCEFVHAVNLLKDASPTAELAAIHVKALCELDEKLAARTAAAHYLTLFPESGQLHYLSGMALYLAGEARCEIESAFLAAAERQYSGAALGLAFLEFAAQRPENTVRLLENTRTEDRELEHIRLLNLFQVHAATGATLQAEASLRLADRVLCQSPSLLRNFWGQLCWVRLLRSKGSFEGALAVLQRILDQLDEHLMPRLHRNALEAKRMIDERSDHHNLVVPQESAVPIRAGASPGTSLDLRGITRKPMLHSLFSYLSARGERGATKEDIVTGVWEENYNPMIHDDRIYKAIGRLRKLLGDDQHAPKYLTQMGRNYILNVPAHPDSSQETT